MRGLKLWHEKGGEQKVMVPLLVVDLFPYPSLDGFVACSLLLPRCINVVSTYKISITSIT